MNSPAFTSVLKRWPSLFFSEEASRDIKISFLSGATSFRKETMILYEIELKSPKGINDI